MKRFYHCFALLTALSALLAALTVATCADYSDPVDMGLVFSPVTRLEAYVDGEWNADLSGSYGFGDTAAVTAPDVGGKSSSHWEADGSVISYAKSLKLTMNAHTTLSAVYADAAPTAKPVAGITSVTRTSDGGSSALVEQNKTGFVDVPAGSFYEDAVAWAVEAGVTTGTDATHFSPNAACTRAQTVTFLWRAAGSPEPTTTTTFTDVPANDYYTKAVQWAAENGVTTGTSATSFSPNDNCLRAQIVTFLYRAYEGK